jgi:hypothetical protein
VGKLFVTASLTAVKVKPTNVFFWVSYAGPWVSYAGPNVMLQGKMDYQCTAATAAMGQALLKLNCMIIATHETGTAQEELHCHLSMLETNSIVSC